MAVFRPLEEYAGLPVVQFDSRPVGGEEDAGPAESLPPAAEAAWYIETYFAPEPFGDIFARFLRTVDTTEVSALIIGYCEDDGAAADDPVALLAEVAASFPRLRSLFLGDVVNDPTEIFWIEDTDITPVFTAFPGLERFEVRGARGLSLAPIRGERLKVLRFESSGLPASVVRAVGASELPNLEHLDLWLGGGDEAGTVVADLAPFLGGERFPALRHLGLEDSEIQVEIAAAVAGAPVVARLESLSLAMGVLTDEGAEALLSGQPLTHLRRFDLHHNFVSDAMLERLETALPGVEIDTGHELPDEYQVIADTFI